MTRRGCPSGLTFGGLQAPYAPPPNGAIVAVADAGASGYQYDAATRTWQFNWKADVPAGCYYVVVTSPAADSSPPLPIRVR